MSDHPRIFSGIQPTGRKHLGNYIGAITQYVSAQDRGEAIFCIVDLHATTVAYDPSELRDRLYDTAAILLASGLDPDRCIFFRQSDVPEHPELAWLLSSVTAFGDLNRMHQFKEKAQGQRDLVSAGLFTYPILMAADVLAYRAHEVPVGDDQRQHIELMRDIAIRFNARFAGPETGGDGDAARVTAAGTGGDGDAARVTAAGTGGDGDAARVTAAGRTGGASADEVSEGPLVVPQGRYREVGARIMDLQEPDRKMSTTGGTAQGTVLVLDSPATIETKFKRAVTDSSSEIRRGPDKPGVSNLIEILAAVREVGAQEIETRHHDTRYGDFKAAVAAAVIERLAPVQERYTAVRDDERALELILHEGAEKAHEIASGTLAVVRERMGVGVPAGIGRRARSVR